MTKPVLIKCQTCKKKATYRIGYIGMCDKHKDDLLCEIILIQAMISPKKSISKITKETIKQMVNNTV
jgi:hypothetical protein